MEEANIQEEQAAQEQQDTTDATPLDTEQQATTTTDSDSADDANDTKDVDNAKGAENGDDASNADKAGGPDATAQDGIDTQPTTVETEPITGADRAAKTGGSESEVVFCDTCGAANPSGARFCQNCATLLPFRHDTGTLTVQTILAGRYELLSRIGQGGMGAVYKAADTRFNNRPVAIKEMSRAGLPQARLQEAEEAFEREAHLLADLLHPNLPRIYEHFAENDRSYLVMDFIEGETLEDYLNKVGGGPLPVDQVMRWAAELCDVLSYLHTHQPPIIFRDLKPANVMISDSGHIFLIDFGIARIFKPGKQHDTVALGSPGYAAPEQYGKAQSSPRSDIYSLGALLHHLLTGMDPSEQPFFFRPASQVNPAVNPALDYLLQQMLDMDSAHRPASAQEVLQSLERATTRMTPGLLSVTSAATAGNDPLLDQAYQAYTQKRLDQAIALYNRAIQADGSNAYAWQGLGLTKGLRAQHQEALTDFERAIQLNPALIPSWNGKGTALSRLRRHQEALVAFERAIELDPNNAAAWNGKGATLNALGRIQPALDAFDMALRFDPRLLQAWNNKGLVLYEMGRFKDAQKAFQEAYDLDPNNAHASFGLGQALYGQRKLKQALRMYEQAIRIDDTFAEAWNRRGNVLDELGDYGAALNSYERSLQLNARLAPAWNGKAGVLRQMGRKGNALYNLKNYGEALLSYERALQYNPRLTTAWHNKSLVLNRLGRYDEALRSADEAIHLRPDDPDHWLRKADALKGLQRRQEARFAEAQAMHLKGNA